MSKYLYNFDPDQAYILANVTNGDGSEKTDRLDFYNKYIGCTVTFMKYDDYIYEDGRRGICMYFKRDPKGKYINRNIHTSRVSSVEETELGLKIHTRNSIYILEKTILNHEALLDASNLIELWFSRNDNGYFCKGYYYDSEKKAHELHSNVHYGIMVDSCLIGTSAGIPKGEYVCRYFFGGDRITFYNALYHQTDYGTLMVIHNNGSDDLSICFEGVPEEWTIPSGESRRFISYSIEGSDIQQEGESRNGL